MAQNKIKPLIFENFNLGGLGDSKWSGLANSLYKIVGIDLHTLPGVIQARQKLIRASSTVVTEFCKQKVSC